MARKKTTSLLLSLLAGATALAGQGVDQVFLGHVKQNAQIEIPLKLTHNLPSYFHSNLTQGWLRGTTTESGEVSALLRKARDANFIIYDSAFREIIGDNPAFEFVVESPDALAFEGGLWLADRDEVWMSSSVVVYERTWVSILRLSDYTIESPTFSGDHFVNPNGGYYHQGKAYFSTVGNESYPAAVVAVDPATKEVNNVVNSYFGLAFNFLDDSTWTTRNGRSYMFFTDYGTPAVFPGVLHRREPHLPNAIWRYDPQDETLIPVIPRSDIAAPNGVRTNSHGTKLFAGDYTLSSDVGIGNSTFGSPCVMEYDLDEDVRPVNKRPFFMARDAAVDGIHMDDYGRVWTAENDAISVRNSKGKLLGSFNTWNLRENDTLPVVANFALAGDKLVVFASTRIWIAKLAQQVVAPGNLS